MKKETLTDLLSTAIHASIEAGRAIMEVYDSGDIKTNLKEDQSPLTIADLRSHSVIIPKLEGTGYPLLSEEGADIPYDERRRWNNFWMVDPLDGTKEFIKRNGEFTVNIAFIERNKPVLGVVYLPVYKRLYYAFKGGGAHRIERIDQNDAEQIQGKLHELSNSLPDKREGKAIRVVASRSHLSPETKEFIGQLERKNKKIELLSAGSALKLCFIAEGRADVYPRLGPTMEWDIAAGHILITESGGALLKLDGTVLEYNKPDLLNPWFVAKSTHYLAQHRNSLKW
jgi:3'(2'), 5'-bisphosphate nucleotidase